MDTKKEMENYKFMSDYIRASSQKPGFKAGENVTSFLFDEISIGESIKYATSIWGTKINTTLDEIIESKADDIMYYIENGANNIMIYGYGSKYELLNRMIDEKIAVEYPVIKVNGFLKSLTLKQVLNQIFTFIVDTCCSNNNKRSRSRSKNTRNSNEISNNDSSIMMEIEKDIKFVKHNKMSSQLEFIEKYMNYDDDDDDEEEDKFGSKYKRLVLVVNSIDGKNLRNVESQKILSKLASFRKITMIATIDNILYQTLLSSEMLSNFNFKFFNINTYDIYHQELKFFEDTIRLNKDHNIHALKFILKSLTSNQKDIIKILARYIISQPDDKGIDIKSFFKLCYEEAVISSEPQLKENMLEIIDHKVIKEIKGDDKKTYYTMDYPRGTLEMIVDGALES